MQLLCLSALFSLSAGSLAFVLPPPDLAPVGDASEHSSSTGDISDVPAKPLPLLIWHGLGDRFDAEGLHSTGELAQQVHPGTYVHYISTADDGPADRTASFFGNVSTQIEEVCAALRADPRLHASNSFDPADGEDDEDPDPSPAPPTLRVDALGFSQGGQFLRGLQQRCDGLRIRSLVTFGSQHNGIARFQACGTWDVVCRGATALVQGNVWTDAAQNKVVPAQYFRATANASSAAPSPDYLEHSHFLADVNNEREEKNAVYARRLARLESFVMFVFDEDTTVIPKESGWFADVNLTSGDVTPLRERALYKEDWLGLRRLDERGALSFRNTSGRHMALDDEVLTDTFLEFFGPERGAGRVLAVRPTPSRAKKGGCASSHREYTLGAWAPWLSPSMWVAWVLRAAGLVPAHAPHVYL